MTPQFNINDKIKVIAGDYDGKSGIIQKCIPQKPGSEVIGFEYDVILSDLPRGKQGTNVTLPEAFLRAA